MRRLSRVIGRTLEEEFCEESVMESLGELLGAEEIPPVVAPIRPEAETDAGKTVRELRESRL